MNIYGVHGVAPRSDITGYAQSNQLQQDVIRSRVPKDLVVRGIEDVSLATRYNYDPQFAAEVDEAVAAADVAQESDFAHIEFANPQFDGLISLGSLVMARIEMPPDIITRPWKVSSKSSTPLAAPRIG